jgi:hypothetical protein
MTNYVEDHMTELQKLIEEIEDSQGNVGNFQAPTKEEWEFQDEEHLFGESYGLDISADLLLDRKSQYLGTLFTRLGKQFTESDELTGADILQTARQFSREMCDHLQEEDEMFMKPESDAEILRSLRYAFNNVIKLIARDKGIRL